MPIQSSRRGVLLGLAASTGAMTMAANPAPSGSGVAAAAPIVDTGVIPFRGPHQAGIVTPQPKAGLVVAFAVLGAGREALADVLKTLSGRIEFLMSGGTPTALDPAFPPSDSGVLGPIVKPDHVTVTLSFGASLFDDRFGLAALKPRHLVTMTGFPNDALEPDLCHGDLLLQICAETPESTIHALRDIIKHTPDSLALLWKQDGFSHTHGATAAVKPTGRNMLGFKDGTANPPVADAKLMNQLVWVEPGAGEPAWAEGGSYQVVRLIRNFVERWDRTPLREQETIIGRDKVNGAPLGMRGEFDDPAYHTDPKGERIPLDAHIRLANPHTRESMARRVLRRGFNYSRGVSKAGQLDMGLLFVCYQSNLTEGFIAIQQRLKGEPLEEYIQPFGGGYFFVPPGVTRPGDYLGRTLVEARVQSGVPSSQTTNG